MNDEINIDVSNKFPKYFSSQNPIERFKGALSDLKLILKTSEYFIGEVKRKTDGWDYEQAKIILYEMYNISRVVKHEAAYNGLDDSLKSFNIVLLGSLTRNLMDGLINIIYLVEECTPNLNSLKKEVWFYKLERKRLITVESYGKISQRLFKLKEEIDTLMKKLSEDSMLQKIKGGRKSVLDFLKNGEEKIFKNKEILKNYNQQNFNSITLHLSQFVHFTPFGINQSRKNMQGINQIAKFIAVMVQHNSVILSEVIGLLNANYNLKLNDNFNNYYKIYHHFLTDTTIFINRNFEDSLNENEEKEFLKAINEYLNFNNREILAIKNSLFFFLSDNNFVLYNEKLTRKFEELRSLKNGIYYLVIPQSTDEVLVLFQLIINNGFIIEVRYIKNI